MVRGATCLRAKRATGSTASAGPHIRPIRALGFESAFSNALVTPGAHVEMEVVAMIGVGRTYQRAEHIFAVQLVDQAVQELAMQLPELRWLAGLPVLEDAHLKRATQRSG